MTATILNTGSTGFSDVKALTATVERMNEEEENGWSYKVESGPKYSFIGVYDEDGIKLGRL